MRFIDAEFKDGNYHEIAYEIVVDGVVIEKDYIMERKHYKDMVKKVKTDRYDRLKSFGKTYKVLYRKHINRILKDKLKDVKYIITHNAYGERNILRKNGIHYEKAKYICTSKISNQFVLKCSPSLREMINHYKLKYDSHFLHYAFEDARMTKEVFYSMIEDFNTRKKMGKKIIEEIPMGLTKLYKSYIPTRNVIKALINVIYFHKTSDI